ncbi:MAG: hypothetical protein H6Q90_3900 [Deltaproteobacteria bacterium]|nr:hypothetical protein [Deltaproteobacteria bacterium]
MCHIVTRKRSNEPVDPAEPERKERVIHTRVPESLEVHLRQRAGHLGISVSNLVRNVLGHAFGLVGDVVADSQKVVLAARGEPKVDAPEHAIDEVIGWQPIVLGKNALCGRCNALLPRGTDASTGVTESGGSRLMICQPCVQALRADPDPRGDLP